MTFTLYVALGNELMQEPEHVADALERTARNLRANLDHFRDDDRGRILDLNGNAVGGWEVSR